MIVSGFEKFDPLRKKGQKAVQRAQKAMQLLGRLSVDSALSVVHFSRADGKTIIGPRAVLEFKAEMKKALIEAMQGDA